MVTLTSRFKFFGVAKSTNIVYTLPKLLLWLLLLFAWLHDLISVIVFIRKICIFGNWYEKSQQKQHFAYTHKKEVELFHNVAKHEAKEKKIVNYLVDE